MSDNEKLTPERAERICPACIGGWHGDCDNDSPVADLYPKCVCDHDE